MSNSAIEIKMARRIKKIEWALAFLDFILFALLAVRTVEPLFMDGQLLPCMALALLPGALLTVFFCRAALSAHRICFAVGLIAFLVMNGTIDPTVIGDALQNWEYIIAGTMIMVLQLISGVFRWMILLRGQGIFIGFFTLMRISLVGYFFNTFIPGATGGDFYRIYSVARGNDVCTTAVSTTVIIDRFMGLPSLMILMLLGVLLNYEFINSHPELKEVVDYFIVFACGCIVFIVSIFAGSLFLRDKVESIEHKVPGGAILTKLTHSIAVYRNHIWIIILALGVSFVAHFATLGSFMFFERAAGVEGVSTSQNLFIVYASLMINSVPLAPGGAGQGELALSWLVDLITPEMGNAPKAAAVMICFRFALLFYALIGGVFYACGKHMVDLKGVEKEAEIGEEDVAKD